MVRQVESEETEFGVRSVVGIEGGPPQVIDFHMPNINQVRAPGQVGALQQRDPADFRKDGRSPSINSLFWRVPVDDEHCISFAVELIPLVGGEAEAYRQQQRVLKDDPLDDGADWSWSDGVLAGRMRLEEIDLDPSASKLFWMEDYITQVGQGAIPDRSQEHLVHVADESVVLKRAIWQRELRALAEELPLKEWTEAEVARS
jgi:hypothetical protein